MSRNSRVLTVCIQTQRRRCGHRRPLEHLQGCRLPPSQLVPMRLPRLLGHQPQHRPTSRHISHRNHGRGQPTRQLGHITDPSPQNNLTPPQRLTPHAPQSSSRPTNNPNHSSSQYGMAGGEPTNKPQPQGKPTGNLSHGGSRQATSATGGSRQTTPATGECRPATLARRRRGVRVAKPPQRAERSEGAQMTKATRSALSADTSRHRFRGRYWDRTSDLFRVREARYRCANRPSCTRVLRWRRDSNPCTRICSPLPRLSATPPVRKPGLPNPLRADDRVRTGDLNLGKVALYQLSYVRVATGFSCPSAREEH